MSDLVHKNVEAMIESTAPGKNAVEEKGNG